MYLGWEGQLLRGGGLVYGFLYFWWGEGSELGTCGTQTQDLWVEYQTRKGSSKRDY